MIAADTTLVAPRLVIVDAAAFQRLLAATPLPDAPELARLAATGGRGDVPALVRSARRQPPARHAAGAAPEDAPPIPLTAVGTAPAVGDADDVVIVDAATAPPRPACRSSRTRCG